jgi:thioester reductase-like protein/putative sterol carrier protein
MLLAGHQVTVLARGTQQVSAQNRIEELVEFWGGVQGRALPRPSVLSGDLAIPGLGLGLADRRWLARHCSSVVHAAASLAHCGTRKGEPWETNVNGTRRLLELMRSLGIGSLHHVSTAFVYGDRRGLLLEDELDLGGGPLNAYQHSKFAAEKLLRQTVGLSTTIYRPSVVLGDSVTGFTSSYHHFYRFLELAVRLSSPAAAGRPGRLPIRLPLTGRETQDLVPVDWVSQAMVRIMEQPRWHGRTYHLVARCPVRFDRIRSIIEELLHIEGIQWAGTTDLVNPTDVERIVLEKLDEYWTYMRSSPVFDSRNLQQALPDLPPPPFELALAARLLAFAQEDRWGRGSRRHRWTSTFGARKKDHGIELHAPSFCAHYLESFLPAHAGQSLLVQALPEGLSFVLDIRGANGGQWTCHRENRSEMRVARGHAADAEITYRTDVETFKALASGSETPQDAFFAGKVEIEGNMEKGLKLAVLFERFFAENRCPADQPREASHDAGSVHRGGQRGRSFRSRPIPA